MPDDGSNTRSVLGLYVHVPFCSSICNYCNFNRGLFDAALKERYVAALIVEIRRTAFAGRPADSIFFGGGTPSLLEPREVEAIIGALRDSFAVAPDAEVTLETNPETVDLPKLGGFRAAGANRISFGVQSFQDDELRRLGRIHSADRARTAIANARAAGIDNVSLDLMMWLPGQSLDRWLANVDALVAADPDHASLYLLELYPNAPLKDEMARAGWSLAPDEDAAQMYTEAMDRLDRQGYRQYEISNVARRGRASRHNLKYWTDGEWVGFGCGAHSTVGGTRWKNVSATEEYVRRVAAGTGVVTERHELTEEERLGDALFTGLRLSDGIDIAEIGERYTTDVWARYGEALQPYIDARWLERRGNRLLLTRAGMLMANEVMTAFV